MSQDELTEQVVSLVATSTGISRSKIHRDTDLAEDLGVAGRDGVELMQQFARRFDVDVTGFDSVKYFGDEASGCNPLRLLLLLLNLSQRGRLSDTTPLKIWMLVEAAEKRKWTFD
jgi:hypothetical protein